MQISLEGARVFITAGGAGMGRATALAMHNVGARVFTCDIDPEEIADLIVLLCSDHGRHISGQIIGVDGNTETLYPRAVTR